MCDDQSVFGREREKSAGKGNLWNDRTMNLNGTKSAQSVVC